jgi:hypothetical protein
LRWENEFPWQLTWQHALGRISRPLTPAEESAEYDYPPAEVLELLGVSASERNEAQRATITKWYRSHVAPELKLEQTRYAQLRREIEEIKPNTVPVMKEVEEGKRRVTHVQLRGNFLALGDQVGEGVPAVFHPLPTDEGPPRLALARWLVDDSNPLTARVTVNRFGNKFSGSALCAPARILARKESCRRTRNCWIGWQQSFVASGWDVKELLKQMVTSAAYRQSSRVTPELLERDPDNLLLARGPRFRMPAEEVRDQALFVSGLLSHKMNGPPVRPPQPSLGLTAAFGGSLDWKTSEGEDRYRRALYVEWRRTNPYPSLATFDAPNREVCALRRPRSNTPLQALVILNDPVYVEAAQALGRRMAQVTGDTAAKATYGFRACLARPPRDRELKRLVEFYDTATRNISNSPKKPGNSPRTLWARLRRVLTTRNWRPGPQ